MSAGEGIGGSVWNCVHPTKMTLATVKDSIAAASQAAPARRGPPTIARAAHASVGTSSWRLMNHPSKVALWTGARRATRVQPKKSTLARSKATPAGLNARDPSSLGTAADLEPRYRRMARPAATTGVGDPGLEPGTSSLSEKRSNRLS
jgi:hypothetical protein